MEQWETQTCGFQNPIENHLLSNFPLSAFTYSQIRYHPTNKTQGINYYNLLLKTNQRVISNVNI